MKKLNKNKLNLISLVLLSSFVWNLTTNAWSPGEAWDSFKDKAGKAVKDKAGEVWDDIKTGAKEKAQSAFKTTTETLTDPDKLFNAASFAARDEYNLNNPYKRVESSVQTYNELPTGERAVIDKRLPLVLNNTNSLIGSNLTSSGIKLNLFNTPRIGIVGGGGGYRAMIANLGFLMGLEKINLLNSILYYSTLSGSTWFLASWILMNKNLTSLNNYLKVTAPSSSALLEPIRDRAQLKKVANNLVRKKAFDNPVSSVDFFGALLANKLFAGKGVERQNQHVSDLQANVKDGLYPYPILTAAQPAGSLKYRIFEITPYSVGSFDLNNYIEPWAVNRQWENGKSLSLNTIIGHQFAPRTSLSWALGVCGSAYASNLNEVYNVMSSKTDGLDRTEKAAFAVLREYINDNPNNADRRISPAKIANFTNGVTGSPISDNKFIELVDAGVSSDLASIINLLRREVDLIIVLDTSGNINNGESLRKAEALAKEKNLKLPKINYENIGKKSLSVFSDPDPKVPTLVYVPLIKDTKLTGAKDTDFDPEKCAKTGFCKTLNFKYTKEQWEQLRNSAEFLATANKDKLVSAVQNTVLKKVLSTYSIDQLQKAYDDAKKAHYDSTGYLYNSSNTGALKAKMDAAKGQLDSKNKLVKSGLSSRTAAPRSSAPAPAAKAAPKTTGLSSSDTIRLHVGKSSTPTQTDIDRLQKAYDNAYQTYYKSTGYFRNSANTPELKAKADAAKEALDEALDAQPKSITPSPAATAPNRRVTFADDTASGNRY